MQGEMGTLALCGEGFRQWVSCEKQPNGPKHVETPVVGLQNLSNSCYLNAILQVLIHTPLLREHLARAFTSRRCLQDQPWLAALLELFDDVVRAQGVCRSVAATSMARLINSHREFAQGRQADAHEAFVFIVARLLEDCLVTCGPSVKRVDYAAKERLERQSLVGHVFGMDLGQTVSCSRCSYASTTTRAEYCLCLHSSLGLSESHLMELRRESELLEAGRGYAHDSFGYGSYSSHSYSSSYAMPRETTVPETSLEGLMHEYTKPEHIDGFRCEKCKGLGCSKKVFVVRRPNVLAVYVDRRQDMAQYGKVKRRVRFNPRLDLTAFSQGGSDPSGSHYSLSAVVVHRDVNGSTSFGHWVAYIRDRFSQWHLMDDSRVTPVQWSEVAEQHCCLLLYAADEVRVAEEISKQTLDPMPATAKVVAAPEAEPSEAEPQEAKPFEVKTLEVKPHEVQLPDAKPVEEKTPELATPSVKPADVKPLEAKPSHAKLQEVKTPEGKSQDVKLETSEPRGKEADSSLSVERTPFPSVKHVKPEPAATPLNSALVTASTTGAHFDFAELEKVEGTFDWDELDRAEALQVS